METAWVQGYDPFGMPWLSTLAAAMPVLLLLGLLVIEVSAPRAALAGLISAVGIAIFAFRMPACAALAAAGYGACFGLLPIGWIVLSAVFLYHLTVRAGQFEVLKQSVAAISPDRRMQVLLIAFSFGTFLEGAAGFGTPVAISAAMLIGLGFRPLYAAGLALIANTAPVAFGALGTPIMTLGQVTGIDTHLLSQMAGRQLPIFSLLIPAWLVFVMGGWRAVRGCWPAIAVCGGSFAVIQFAMSNYHGPLLVDVFGGVGSMVSLAVFLRFWKPREIWRFPDEPPPEANSAVAHPAPRQVAYAWTPWVILSAMLFVWGLLNVKDPVSKATRWPEALARVGQFSFDVPQLVDSIYRGPEVARRTVVTPEGVRRAAEPEKAVYDLPWLTTPGTAIFLAALISAVWLRIRPRDCLAQFFHTTWQVRWAVFTIACMLALAYTTKYSGVDATLGLAFTHTGVLYPFFAPLLGWLGVALTGSDTSANALFGGLQQITAEQLGLNPVLIVASNSTGGVMGKMIDAQSIVVAAVATGQSGQEGQILRFVFWHSVVMAALMGLLTLLQAYVFPGTVPG